MTPQTAGWYPDPDGSGRQRYWNGRAWTEHVSGPSKDPEHLGSSETFETSESSEPGPTDVAAQWDDFASGDDRSGSAPPGWGTESPPTFPAQPVQAAYSAFPPPGVHAADARVRIGPDGQILAGWWRRFGGYMLDSLILSLATGLIALVYASVTGAFSELLDQERLTELSDKVQADPGYQPSAEEILTIMGPDLVPFIFFAFMVFTLLSFLNGVLLVSRSGQTIADRIVRTRKVVRGRQAPSTSAAFVRWLIPNVLNLLGNIPVLGLVAFGAWILDYLWPLWDEQAQAWHDKAARTYVERADLSGPLESARSSTPQS